MELTIALKMSLKTVPENNIEINLKLLIKN